MNEVIRDEGMRVPVKCWNHGVEFEEQAREQLRNLATIPCVFHHVAAMPDVHAGFGSTVGSVFATKGAIIPAAVGVDIGCGMMAVRTSLVASDLPDNLFGLRSKIEEVVPVGAVDSGFWRDTPKHIAKAYSGMSGPYNAMREKHSILGKDRGPVQLGTLGGGNHFIEVCLDEAGCVWVMLHSGSRGPGNQIGRYFIELAKREMERWFIHLPDADLAYLPEGSRHYEDYLAAVSWAQNFASLNRELMMKAVLGAMREVLGRNVEESTEYAVNCHHNYVEQENHFGSNVWVTRKGAVRARKGDWGIIPGSMGARSFIVRGKGNPESFNSCSHGAGRTMSRTAARHRFTAEDLAAQTDGIECAKDESRVDEIPAAYKDIDAVMAAQQDLVEVVSVLRQVVCVKG